MRLALHEPDIPQNCGTLMRLCAALGVPLDVIEPCGFVLDDRRLGRALMDYGSHLAWSRHASWADFRAATATGRLVLLDPHEAVPHTRFAFAADDVLLAGSESAGVPAPVRAAADAVVAVPMRPGVRSLNVAVACAMVLGEALRQTGHWNGAGGGAAG